LKMNSLAGKVAVITGASRGLGERAAFRLSQNGAAVALVARSAAQLEKHVQTIKEAGGAAIAIPTDLTNLTPDGASAIRSQVEAGLGTPTILINGAGIFGPIRLIKDVDPEAWLDTIKINTFSAFLLCQTFLNGMINAGWGRIVNITSAAALHEPGPINSAYATSKVALNQLTRHLAAELTGTGVTANVIHPGDVKTYMWQEIRDTVNQMGPEAEAYRQWASWVAETGGDDPEKAADLIVQLMSDEASETTGQFLWIADGLQNPIPSWGEPTTEQPWRK
jgi:NAD(P)-dependent dehydrogenase (short-subunit alcohol dehydrogenase family)